MITQTKAAPESAPTLIRGLTHSLDATKEGLMLDPTQADTERLWSKVRKTDTGCWEYQGYRVRGYGQFHINGRPVRAHRVAWEATHGPIPDGMVVRHRCDNPPCCNPDHLELGTHADNVRDMVDRGRIAKGNRLPHSKLTPGAVIAIKADLAQGLPQHTIAAAFGVNQAVISRIHRNGA